jgi:hypothetical protein
MSTPLSPASVEDFGEYEVFDIVAKGQDEHGKIMYRVKWKGYADPRSDTWEYSEHLGKDGQQLLMEMCDKFLEWKVQVDFDDGEIVRTQREFRKTLGAVLYANDSKRMCFFTSIDKIGNLLGVDIDTHKLQEGYPNGVPLSKIRAFFTLHPILKVYGTSKKKWRMGNYIKGSTKGHSTVPYTLSKGVYLCAAFNNHYVGHVFVLEVRQKGNVIVHDPSEETACIYDRKYCQWIKSWVFLHRVAV